MAKETNITTRINIYLLFEICKLEKGEDNFFRKSLEKVWMQITFINQFRSRSKCCHIFLEGKFNVFWLLKVFILISCI